MRMIFRGFSVALSFLLFFPLLGASGLAAQAGPPAVSPAFRPLVERLVGEGFERGRVEALFSDKRVRFDTSCATGYFRHNESKLDYGQFLSGESMGKARKYLRENREALNRAHDTFGVNPEIITAILLVETRLGTFVGKRPVFTTFATLASLSEKQNRDRLWEELSTFPDTDRGDLEKWSGRKSDWAFAELSHFLIYSREQKLDPLEVPGSYAGAMGFSQFLPSSARSYAEDGNGDGKIDLFQHEDAIFSIARYLNSNGWKPGLGKDGMRKVLYTYNRSRPYADTLLSIQEILREDS